MIEHLRWDKKVDQQPINDPEEKAILGKEYDMMLHTSCWPVILVIMIVIVIVRMHYGEVAILLQ